MRWRWRPGNMEGDETARTRSARDGAGEVFVERAEKKQPLGSWFFGRAKSALG